MVNSLQAGIVGLPNVGKVRALRLHSQFVHLPAWQQGAAVTQASQQAAQ